MAIAAILDFNGATLDQYDQVIEKMGFTPGGKGAPGGLFHWVAATDEHGDTQKTREIWYAQYRPTQIYHYNAIQTWQVNESGEVSNVYV